MTKKEGCSITSKDMVLQHGMLSVVCTRMGGVKGLVYGGCYHQYPVTNDLKCMVGMLRDIPEDIDKD
jgi:hypothetical protein